MRLQIADASKLHAATKRVALRWVLLTCRGDPGQRYQASVAFSDDGGIAEDALEFLTNTEVNKVVENFENRVLFGFAKSASIRCLNA